jgi:GGDEF domain-containing protein
MISEHIGRLLASGADFVACYADLSDFKPFNDLYGYWQGDEAIKLAASVITRHCDAAADFVGHVGGDDFVVLFQSEDWQQRCERMVAEFADRVPSLYDEAARATRGIRVEDRHGVERFFPFTALYVGAVRASDAAFASDAARSVTALVLQCNPTCAKFACCCHEPRQLVGCVGCAEPLCPDVGCAVPLRVRQPGPGRPSTTAARVSAWITAVATLLIWHRCGSISIWVWTNRASGKPS